MFAEMLGDAYPFTLRATQVRNEELGEKEMLAGIATGKLIT